MGSLDRVGARTPMRCPVCGGGFDETIVRDLGGLTADLVWELHCGRCPEHGWFQTEVISRPPREIFAVNKPFGVARRMVVDGRERYSFETVWNDAPIAVRRSPIDPFEPAWWAVKPTVATG